jgi:hypothetical protein
MRKIRNEFVKNLHYLCLTGVIALGLMTIVATGGGGGGGGGGGAPPPITYTGLTDPATVNENNAEALSVGALIGYTAGSDIPIVAVQGSWNSDIELPLNLRLPRVLEEAVYQLDIPSHSVVRPFGAIECESETFYGDCGGSAYGYVCVDNVSGAFDGYFNFSGYCSEGVIITGRVDFSGTIDVYTYDFLQLNFSFNNVSVVSGGYSFTLAGTVNYDFTPPVSVTMDMLLCDNGTGKVYWVCNYTMALTEGPGYVDVEISGRFYDPDYGYVIVTTPKAFRLYIYDDWPSEGELIVTGASNTSAKLTALSSTTYQVEADTDGDGSYDWDSGILNWSDL